MHDHLIDDLGLAIFLRVEGSGFCELGVQQTPETRPKGVEEHVVSVGDDGLWYPKVYPHSFKEEIGSICRCDILITGCEDGHPQKPINDHKHAVISLLAEWKSRDVIH